MLSRGDRCSVRGDIDSVDSQLPFYFSLAPSHAALDLAISSPTRTATTCEDNT